jgi:hypothetical protein
LDGAQYVLYTDFQKASIPSLIVLQKEQRRSETIGSGCGRGYERIEYLRHIRVVMIAMCHKPYMPNGSQRMESRRV